MTRTVLLNGPIKAEIRAVDSQSDLRILCSYDYKLNKSSIRGFFFWGQTGHFAALKRPPANLEFEDCGYEIGKLVSLSSRASLTLWRTSRREPWQGGGEIAIHLHCFCFGSPCGSQDSLLSHTTSFSVSFLPLISSRF